MTDTRYGPVGYEGRGGNTGHTVTLVSAAGAGSWSGNVPPPRTDAEALEIRLRSLLAGELEARVAVAVREAVAPLTRDVAKLLDAVQALSRGRVDVPSVRS